ncbi:MAG: LptF/LptG family permease [Planctomycetales bacterium]
MLTLFDRYLFWRYWHAYIITFLAVLGLFVVIDAFNNIDEFARDGAKLPQIMLNFVQYYCYQGCVFFRAVGGLVTCLATMLVLATLVKNGELNPVLSAGITTYRIARPLLLGALTVNICLLLDQEFVIPAIANELQLRPGQDHRSSDRINPAYDYSSRIGIQNGRYFVKEQKIVDCDFVLPFPKIAERMTTLRATEGKYVRNAKHPEQSGWYLKGVSPRFDELQLTEYGKGKVMPGKAPDELIVRTMIGFGQLVTGQRSFDYLSTKDLLERVQSPAYGSALTRTLSSQIHTRVTKPILNLLLILLLIPLVIRKESRGLVTNLGLATLASAFVLSLDFVFGFLGSARLIPLDLTAWGPVVVCGFLSAWMSGSVRT